MNTYRIAILGCRSRGQAAALAYHEHPRTEVVGLCDLASDRREDIGALLGVQALYEDLDTMILETQPDIVCIPTGTEFHCELAMRVLKHRVNIDVEKPLATALYEADEVIALADEMGVRVAVHHQGRTGHTMRALKNALADGHIGEMRYLSGSGKGYYAGYGLMNIGTHVLNNMLGIAGACSRVSASALTDGRRITPEDVLPSANGMGTIAGEKITAELEFENGVTGTLIQHRFMKVDTTAYAIEVCGTEGRLYWKSGDVWITSEAHTTPDSAWEKLEAVIPDAHTAESRSNVDDYWFADEYVAALDAARDHESSGAQGRHVLEIIMGMFESAARGVWVSLPQAERDHPLERWRKEAGLGEMAQVPRPYGDWLSEEDRRLGRS